MAKRETRDEAVKRAAQLGNDLFAAQFCMRALVRGDVPVFERLVTGENVIDETLQIRVRAWEIQRADGGYVLVEHGPACVALPTAHSVLDWCSRWTERQHCVTSFDFAVRSAARALYAAMVEANKATG
jgi:hypothetical protein